MTAKKYINNNLPAYINLEMHERGVDIDTLVKVTGVEKKCLEDVLNCQSRIKYNESLEKIISFLQLDSTEIFSRKLYFEKIRNQFFKSIFYCLEERKSLYRRILEYTNDLKNTPYYIDFLMIKYVYCVSVMEDYAKLKLYISRISKIFSSVSIYYRKMYYVFLLSYLENTSQYHEINNVYSILSSIKCSDNLLDGRIYYVSFSIFRGIGNIEKAKQYYFLAKKSFTEMENHAMLENLNIKYSILLRSVGELKEALQSDLKLLEEYTIKNYRLRNIEILYNNIAWNYSLLHDYRKAVLYYQKALESLQDNDILFNMAYCCYQIDEISQALHYLELGRNASNCGEYIYRLIEWLECMVKDKYGAKTLSILLSILSDYSNDIEKIDRDTIQIEIINYYYYNGMYEEAINALQPLMGKQLISPSELIFAKDNGKTEHDTLSFEDMDDTWNNKMIIKDDDLFFDDEKINDDDWEELDDSFSSFAFN